METGLEGRLAKVKIIGIAINGLPYGYVRDYPKFNGKVLVNRAEGRVGQFCIVRFNLYSNREDLPPLGNFISSATFNDFLTIPPEKYILYGKWHNNWPVKLPYPNLDQINEYFDPGSMGKAIFCRVNGKRAIIYQDNFTEINLSFRNIIPDYMPQPSQKARVIIVSSDEDLYSVIKQTKRKNLVPVKMEPLRSSL